MSDLVPSPSHHRLISTSISVLVTNPTSETDIQKYTIIYSYLDDMETSWLRCLILCRHHLIIGSSRLPFLCSSPIQLPKQTYKNIQSCTHTLMTWKLVGYDV